MLTEYRVPITVLDTAGTGVANGTAYTGAKCAPGVVKEVRLKATGGATTKYVLYATTYLNGAALDKMINTQATGTNQEFEESPDKTIWPAGGTIKVVVYEGSAAVAAEFVIVIDQ